MIDPRNPDFANTPVSALRATMGYAPAPGSHAPAPLVSVVTPFFNTGEVFRETGACLLGAQSLQNFEWVIVNDGSTDAAALKLLDESRALAQADQRIRII